MLKPMDVVMNDYVSREELQTSFLALHKQMQELTIRLTQLENKVTTYINELDDSRDSFYNGEVKFQ